MSILDAEGNPVVSTDETPEVPVGLEGAKPETLAELASRLKALNASPHADGVLSDDQQLQGSGPEAPPAPEAPPITGADVEWSDFELDPSLAHLYPQARLQETKEGPRWVVTLDQHHTALKNLGSYGDRDKRGQAKNLGEYIDDMVNGPDQWAVAGLVPGGTMGMAGVILRRQRTFVLPEPHKLQTEATVEVEVTPEERQADEATSAWMEEEGLTTGEEPATVELTPEEIERKARAQELKRAAIEKEEALLAANVPATMPNPKNSDQPAPVVAPWGRLTGAGVVDAGQQAMDALTGDDFEKPVE